MPANCFIRLIRPRQGREPVKVEVGIPRQWPSTFPRVLERRQERPPFVGDCLDRVIDRLELIGIGKQIVSILAELQRVMSGA